MALLLYLSGEYIPNLVRLSQRAGKAGYYCDS